MTNQNISPELKSLVTNVKTWMIDDFDGKFSFDVMFDFETERYTRLLSSIPVQISHIDWESKLATLYVEKAHLSSDLIKEIEQLRDVLNKDE